MEIGKANAQFLLVSCATSPQFSKAMCSYFTPATLLNLVSLCYLDEFGKANVQFLIFTRVTQDSEFLSQFDKSTIR